MSALPVTGWRVAVAYSGGRDSTALLYATARMARELGGERGGIDVVALHVHHGLSPNADAWLAHAQAQCAAWALAGLPVSLRWQRLALRPSTGDSIEALARDARYAALARMAREAGCDTVLLGHHRRDQAETFLLQALRGAGVAGLAAMPECALRDGITWLRPWLGKPRETVEAYVTLHGLSHVEDDSNGARRHARNRLRLDVWPALTQAFGQAETVLSQAAAHQADVLACLEDWLADKLPLVTRATQATGGQPPQAAHALDVAAWSAWPPGPQRELLRAWFHQTTGRRLPASWTARLQIELRPDACGRWPVPGMDDADPAQHGELVLYRGLLRWRVAQAPASRGEEGSQGGRSPSAWPLRITSLGVWTLPDGLGVLTVSATAEGERGLPLARLAHVELRLRQGGERFQIGPGRPARSLKKQFQMLGVPVWAREGPLLWSDDELLFVPGLGLHAPAMAEAPGPGQVALSWAPQGSSWPDQDSIRVTE